MRKILLMLLISLSLTSIAASQDYFPLREGNQWSYTMSNGVEMTMKISGFSEVDGVRCAIVESTAQNAMGSQVSTEYLTIDSEGLKVYMSQTLDQEIRYYPPVIRIKLPFQQGQIWTSTLDQASISLVTTFRSVGTQEITTQAGNFKCIVINSRISVPGQGIVTSENYYADGTGLVRQVMSVAGQTITSSLKSYNVKPTENISAPSNTTQLTKCPFCGADIKPGAKFCSSCGKEIPRVTAPPQPQAPTVCPNCGAKLPEGAKFCPECGEPIVVPTSTKTVVVDPNEEKKIVQYLSPRGTLMLYKPQNWEVIEQNLGSGAYAATIMRPDETAVAVFVTFQVGGDVNNSVSLAGACLRAFKDEIPDLDGKNVKSTSDRSRTIMDITFTEEQERGVGHGYFFYTQNVGTVYLLLARDDLWKQMRPILTTIASNIAYSPEGIDKVIDKGKEIANQTVVVTQERVLNPAAMIQKAKNSTGKQLQLVPAELTDGSLALRIPENWSIEGQELEYVLVDDRQMRSCGMNSISQTIIPSPVPVPGVMNAEYLPPPQALSLILQSQNIGTEVEILGELPGEQALPELAQAVQTMRMQGLRVDSRLIHVKFRGVGGRPLRGIFSVQCMSIPMSPVWQVSVDGSWAPDEEFEEWLPLFLRIGETLQVNQQKAQAVLQDRYYAQQQLNRNLQNSIAGANQVFDEYMVSLQNADRSRDYTSWMWSQTTLGQGTWVANNEGADVYQTNSFGIHGPDDSVDRPAYNTTNFTGVSPWTQEQLELIDTRPEFEQYLKGN
jgi:hypothetical protein